MKDDKFADSIKNPDYNHISKSKSAVHTITNYVRDLSLSQKFTPENFQEICEEAFVSLTKTIKAIDNNMEMSKKLSEAGATANIK